MTAIDRSNYDRNSNISISNLEGILMVIIDSELDTTILTEMQDRIMLQVQKSKIIGVILDVSQVHIIDSFIIKKISDLMGVITMLGSIPVLSGLRPEVVTTIVTLNIPLSSNNTVLNVQRGIEMIKKLTESSTSIALKDEDNAINEDHGKDQNN